MYIIVHSTKCMLKRFSVWIRHNNFLIRGGEQKLHEMELHGSGKAESKCLTVLTQHCAGKRDSGSQERYERLLWVSYRSPAFMNGQKNKTNINLALSHHQFLLFTYVPHPNHQQTNLISSHPSHLHHASLKQQYYPTL